VGKWGENPIPSKQPNFKALLRNKSQIKKGKLRRNLWRKKKLGKRKKKRQEKKYVLHRAGCIGEKVALGTGGGETRVRKRIDRTGGRKKGG